MVKLSIDSIIKYLHQCIKLPIINPPLLILARPDFTLNVPKCLVSSISKKIASDRQLLTKSIDCGDDWAITKNRICYGRNVNFVKLVRHVKSSFSSIFEDNLHFQCLKIKELMTMTLSITFF